MHITQEHTAELLGAILEELKTKRIDDRLWNTDDIALYVGTDRKSVQNTTVKHRTFPRPVILPTGGRRWVPEDVRRWAMSIKA